MFIKKKEWFYMHGSPIMRILMMVSWLITSLVSINMLTGMYDYNAIIYIGNMMPALIVPLMWIIGLAGIFSLVAFIRTVMMGCSGCDSCPCTCEECKCK
jgi:hypothetical protein